METRYHSVDVCVIGGGMAGLCAALASARRGAKTLLVQDRPVFGGNASSEVRMWICGAHGANLKETGILEEIQLQNCFLNPSLSYTYWDAILHGKARFQPNLELLLNCSCTGCEAEGPADDRVIHRALAWQLTTQLWHSIEARLFIDCSGDSILAPSSGADFRSGRESRAEFGESIAPEHADKKTMGNSILIQIRKTEDSHPFVPPPWAYRFESPEQFPYRMKGVKGTNFWWIELGGLQDTIHDAESIRDDLLRTAWGVWDYIKNRAPEREEASTWALEWIGSLPGKRENRRYLGPQILTQHDIESGGDFHDRVSYGGWSMDDHHPAGFLYPGFPTLYHPAPSPYGIPFRCLYSRNVRNLLMAGRNISTTHTALSSTRVMATCSLLGQAAGTAAALALRLKTTPAGLYPDHIPVLQQQLMADDCWLPGLTREISPLAANADLSPEYRVLLDGHDRPVGREKHHWEGDPGTPIEFSWPERQSIAALRLVADSNLKLHKRMPCSYPAPGPHGVPRSLLRAWRLEAETVSGGWETVLREDHHHQRFSILPVHRTTRRLRFVPESTWGEETVRLFSLEPLQEEVSGPPSPPTLMTWSERLKQVDPADLAIPPLEQEAIESEKLTQKPSSLTHGA